MKARAPGPVTESHVLDLSSKLVFCSAQSLLEATQKLVLLAFGKDQIVVSQLTIFLFKFALNFVPVPFICSFITSNRVSHNVRSYFGP